MQAGIDPIYFGVLFIINNSIGLITPPVGTVLNVVCGVAKVRMDDIIKGVWPFMIAQLVVLFLLVLSRGSLPGPAKWFRWAARYESTRSGGEPAASMWCH